MALGQPTFWLQADVNTAITKIIKSAGGKRRENFIDNVELKVIELLDYRGAAKNVAILIQLSICLLWYWVVHRMFAPWVAAQNSRRRQISAFERPPYLQGFDGIVRTGWLVTAFVHSQKRRKRYLIKPDKQDEKMLDQKHECLRWALWLVFPFTFGLRDHSSIW